MTSFQITISPTRRAAARFVATVRRALQKALEEEGKKRGLTQSDIARELTVHRSVINRELRGDKDLTLGRIGELAHALGRKPVFSLPEKVQVEGANRSDTRENMAEHIGLSVVTNPASAGASMMDSSGRLGPAVYKTGPSINVTGTSGPSYISTWDRLVTQAARQ